MAEIIVVVAAVASFIQLVDFSFKIVHRLTDYTSQAKDVPQSLHHITIELPVLLVGLKTSAQAITLNNITDEVRRALQAPIKECGIEIECLLKILLKILPKPGSSRKRRIWKDLWSLRYDAKVKNKMTIIRDYAQTLSYYHVTFLSLPKTITVYALPKPLPSSTVPYHRNPDFVADPGILRDMRQKLNRPASRLGVFGLGGVGKSALAIEYAYSLREASPVTWIFWIHASTRARFEQGCHSIAKATKLPGWDNPKSNFVQLAFDWLHNNSNGPWLMILDGADDLDIFLPGKKPTSSSAKNIATTGYQSLVDLIPHSSNGSVLVTSRNPKTASCLNLRSDEVLEVKQMSQDYALQLLNRKMSTRVKPDREEAIKLVKLLEYLPLAISQAAAYLKTQDVSIKKYIQMYNELPVEMDDLLDARRVRPTVITTWTVSLNSILQDEPSAACLLSLMSLCDCQGIPESLLKVNYSASFKALPASQATKSVFDNEDEFDRDVSILMAYSMVKMNSRDELEMHPMVQSAMKRRMQLTHEYDRWKSTYIDILHDIFAKGNTNENEDVCETLLPHVEAMLAYQPSSHNQSLSWVNVVLRAAEICWKSERYRQSEILHQLAFEVQQRQLQEKNPLPLQALDKLRRCNDADKLDSRARELVQDLIAQIKRLEKKLHFLEYIFLFFSLMGLIFVKGLFS